MSEFKHNNKDVLIGIGLFAAMVIFMAILAQLLN